jgi:hypothetical protein
MHWDKLPKNQPAEIAMFQISEVHEAPAFNGRRSFLVDVHSAKQMLAQIREFGKTPAWTGCRRWNSIGIS